MARVHDSGNLIISSVGGFGIKPKTVCNPRYATCVEKRPPSVQDNQPTPALCTSLPPDFPKLVQDWANTIFKTHHNTPQHFTILSKEPANTKQNTLPYITPKKEKLFPCVCRVGFLRSLRGEQSLENPRFQLPPNILRVRSGTTARTT